ncbi:hypothetical protein MMC11_004899 [Xylographa trunciseda]|nr:hypothetical protein [Xylographa trunciseda]
MHLSPLSLQVLSLLLALHSLPVLSAPSPLQEPEQDIEHQATPQERTPPEIQDAGSTHNDAAITAAAAANAPPPPSPAGIQAKDLPPRSQQAPPMEGLPNASATKARPSATRKPSAAAPTSTVAACFGIGAHNPYTGEVPLAAHKPAPVHANPVAGAPAVACGSLTSNWTMSDRFFMPEAPVQLDWVLDWGNGSIGIVANQSDDPTILVPVMPYLAVTAGKKRFASFSPDAGVQYSVQLEGQPANTSLSWWMNRV